MAVEQACSKSMQRSTRPWSARLRQSFTLMEVMITVSLMAVVFALILPMSENATPQYRLEAGIRQVAGIIETAHSEAVSSIRPFAVVYDFDANQIFIIAPIEREVDGDPEQTRWVLEENNPETYIDPEDLPQDVFIASVQTAQGESFSSGRRIIHFDAGGYRGSHIVTLGVNTGDTGRQSNYSVKYNTMTRSLVYSQDQLSFFRE